MADSSHKIDLPSRFLLPELAGLGDVAPIYVYPGGLQIASGATAVFCQSSLGNMIEGEVVGIYFYLDSEDYQTSPVSLVFTSAQAGQSSAGLTYGNSQGGSPWPMQLGRDRDLFWFRSPWSIKFPQGSGVGLQVKNNETVPLYAEGIIAVAGWPIDASRDSQRALAAASQGGSPWPPVFTKKGGP